MLVGVVKTRATMGKLKRRPPSQWASRMTVAKTDNSLSPQTTILAEDALAAAKKSGELPSEKMGGTVVTEPTPIECNIAATKVEASSKYDELCKVPPKATAETKEASEVPAMVFLSPKGDATDEKLEAGKSPSKTQTTICPDPPPTAMGPMGADVEETEANGKEKNGEESLSAGCRKEEDPDKRPQTITTGTTTEERTRRERKNRTGALFENLAQLRRRWAPQNCNIL